MSQLFAWGGQSTEVSALASFLPKNTQDWSSLEWTGWISLHAVQGTLKSLLQHHSSKASILRHSAFFTVQLSHPYMTTGKTIALTRWTFVDKVMSLRFEGIMLAEIRQISNEIERQILYVLTYIRNLKSWIHRHRDQNDGFQMMRRGYGEMRVKGYQHSSLRWISSGHLVHIMVIIANKTVLYPWKLWRE